MFYCFKFQHLYTFPLVLEHLKHKRIHDNLTIFKTLRKRKNNMIIKLPYLPVSANKAYYTDRHSYSRHKTKEYKQFIKDTANFITGETIKGEVQIELNFFYPLYYKNGNRRKLDKNNFEKTLTDTLIHYGVIEDDCWIRRTLIESYDSEERRTVIEIKPFTLSKKTIQ